MKKYFNLLFLFYITFFVGWNGKTILQDNNKSENTLQPAIGFNKSIIQLGEVLKTGIAVFTDTEKIKCLLSLNFDFLGFGYEINKYSYYKQPEFPTHEFGFSYKTDLTNYKNQYFGFYLGRKFLLKKGVE